MSGSERKSIPAKEEFIRSAKRANLMRELGEDPQGFGLIHPPQIDDGKSILIYWHPKSRIWIERDYQGKTLSFPKWGGPKEELSDRAIQAVLEYFEFSKKRRSDPIKARNLLARSPTSLIQTSFFPRANELRTGNYSGSNPKGEARRILKKMAELGHRNLQGDFKAEEIPDPIGRLWAEVGGRELDFNPTSLSEGPMIGQEKDPFSLI